MATSAAKMTDEAMLSGISEKRESAYAELYRRFGGMVIGHVRKNSGTEADANEIMQLTMVKFYQALSDGRYEHQGKLGHYIFQLAANSWREELRRRRNRPTETLDDPAFQLEDESHDRLAEIAVKDRQLNALHRALAAMGNPCRDLIRNYHLKRQKLKVLATQLNYDYNSLRKRLFDCRKKLKMNTEALLAQ